MLGYTNNLHDFEIIQDNISRYQQYLSFENIISVISIADTNMASTAGICRFTFAIERTNDQLVEVNEKR